MLLSGNIHVRDSLRKIWHYFYIAKNYNKLNPVTGVEVLAYEETMDYVKKNMYAVTSFMTPSQLLTHAVKNISIEGDVWEFGVYKGGSIRHIAKQLPHKEVHGFDSFEGLPEDWYNSALIKGTFSVDGKLPKVPSNVTLHKGWFNETIPTWKKSYEGVPSLIHIDCDIYSATKTVFDELGDRIKEGTVIVFDEYFNYPNWKDGEFKAFQNFIKKNDIKYKYIGFSRMQVAIKIEKVGK